MPRRPRRLRLLTTNLIYENLTYRKMRAGHVSSRERTSTRYFENEWLFSRWSMNMPAFRPTVPHLTDSETCRFRSSTCSPYLQKSGFGRKIFGVKTRKLTSRRWRTHRQSAESCGIRLCASSRSLFGFWFPCQRLPSCSCRWCCWFGFYSSVPRVLRHSAWSLSTGSRACWRCIRKCRLRWVSCLVDQK